MKLKIAVMFAIATILILPSYAIQSQRYAWIDGTTAPLECITQCKEAGVQVEYKVENDIHYLTDACKASCYGENAVFAQNPAAPVQKNTQNKKIQQTQKNNSAKETVQPIVKQKRETIENIITQRKQIRASQLSNDSINISPNSISVPGHQISAVAKTISAQVRNRELNIIQEQTQVIIEDGDVNASSHSVEIQSGELRIDGIALGLLPSQIKPQIKGELKQLRIKQENRELIYEATADRHAKLLGLFDVDYEMTTQFDAQTANIKSSNKPLWSILAFE